MATVNISLPVAQVKMIDEFTNKFGFASRSEFFRTLLRWVKANPLLVNQAQTWPFFSPQTKSKKEILKAFGKSKKYSPDFLKDLAEGLENSNYFTE